MYTLILTLLSSISFAGNFVGNGGDGIYCPGTKGQKNKAQYQSLDFFEWRESSSMNKLESKGDEWASAEFYINQINSDYPTLQKQLKLGLLKVNRQKVWIKDGLELRDIQDSYQVAMPKNCKLIQLAARYEQSSKSQTQFFFDQHYFNKLNESNKTALILHEVVYDWLLGVKKNDSSSARWMVGQILSKKFNSDNLASIKMEFQRRAIPLY